MSTWYEENLGILPAVWMGRDGEHRKLVEFILEHGAGTLEDGDLHFRVRQSDVGGDPALDDLDDLDIVGAPHDPTMHGGNWLYSDAEPKTPPLLQRLVRSNKVCLVYQSWWSSGGGGSHEDDADGCQCGHVCPDAIEMADSLPTLILQELIARRQEDADDSGAG